MERSSENKIEKGTPLSELKMRIPILAQYMESSKNFYNFFGVDLEIATYNEETKELTFIAAVPKTYQAYENQLHGGASAALLDSVAGIVAVIEAGKEGKKSMTGSLTIKYLRPIVPDMCRQICKWG